MWPFHREPVITLREFERRLKLARVPYGFVQIVDAAERQRALDRYVCVREQLWRRHLKALPPAVREELAAGVHPSRSWDRSATAEPMTKKLEAWLDERGIAARVVVGFYHCDRLVLTADLASEPGERRGELPWLFHGYEVKYAWPLKAG